MIFFSLILKSPCFSKDVPGRWAWEIEIQRNVAAFDVGLKAEVAKRN